MALPRHAEPQQHRNILRNAAVTARTGLSPSQRWRLERRGEFPARVQLSQMSVGWFEHEIDTWVASRPRAGGKQPPLPKSRRQPPPQAPHSNGAGRPIDNVLDRRIDEIGLSNRARNALVADGIEYVGELVQRSEQELLSISNFGRVSLADVESALAELKLHLDMQLPDWDRSRHVAAASAAE
jgi:predicted DNA-binding transcriptional regulator AlpA